MPYAIMISYIVSVKGRPFLYCVHWQWQLTADSYTAQPQLLWHGTGHYVEERIIYFICSGYLLIHLYINMYLYIESLYLYSNQPK